MKRIIALLLAVMMVFCLCACGGEDTSGTNGGDTAKEATTDKAKPKEVNYPETVLVDNEYCTFTVKSIDANSSTYTLNVALENKSDVDLMFAVEYTSVDGWMLDPFWAETVTAGMKSNSSICWGTSALKDCGITDVNCINFRLRIYDDNSWDVDAFVNEDFSIYPLGAESFTPELRQSVADDIVLVDNDEYSVIVTGFDPDNLWGYTMKVYLCNKTDKALMFAIDEASVNGYMCDPFWASSVAAGCQEYCDVSWNSSDFEANGISEVEEITLPFHISDDNTGDTLFSDTFTVNP